MGLFGFTSIKDAFDGGGAGKSGDTYSTEGVGISNTYFGDKPSSNDSSGGAPTTSLRPVSRPTITVAKDDNGNTKRNDKGDPIYTTSRDESNAASFVELNPAAASGNFSEYAPGTVNESNNMIQKMISGHPFAMGTNKLTGSDIKNDLVVNIVDGKPIRQRKDGSLYALNALGLPYDLSSADSLTEDQSQVDKRDSIMGNMGSSDDGLSGAGAGADIDTSMDPCPDGYVYDQEQLMCVIDTDVGIPRTPRPSIDYNLPDPNAVVPGGNPGYTQPVGNFIPTPLQPTAPNPIQQQLNQLSRSIGAPPQQQQRPGGLAGANTGIMQVRP